MLYACSRYDNNYISFVSHLCVCQLNREQDNYKAKMSKEQEKNTYRKKIKNNTIYVI
jgi:hypothetical protein